MSNRPTGVTILAILALIGGLISLFLGGFETLLGPQVGEEMSKQTTDTSAAAYGSAITVMGIGLLFHGVLQLITAFGLFALKAWAWLLAVVMQVLSLVLNGMQLAADFNAGVVTGGIVALIILYYLYRPHVKQAFGRA